MDSERYYYSVDEQGSTIFITDSNEQVKNEYWYDAFGNVLESKEDIHKFGELFHINILVKNQTGLKNLFNCWNII